jgi:shikimate kinase
MPNAKKKEIRNPKLEIRNPICLVGFMGAGKTVTARELAVLTNAEAIDLDEFIETRENRSIPHLIENLGEAVFREIEADALDEILRLSADNQIIALGGGAWTIEKNRKLIAAKNFRTVWLDAPFETCWQRICIAGNSRPLAQNKTVARKLFSARRPIYQTAEIQIKIRKTKTLQQICAEILKKSNLEARKSLG